jgi:hypothetical protein
LLGSASSPVATAALKKMERSRSGRSSNSAVRPWNRIAAHEECFVGGGERHIHRLFDEDPCGHGTASRPRAVAATKRQGNSSIIELRLGEERHRERQHLR